MRALIQRFVLVRQARIVARVSSEASQAVDQTQKARQVHNDTGKGSIESDTPRLR